MGRWSFHMRCVTSTLRRALKVSLPFRRHFSLQEHETSVFSASSLASLGMLAAIWVGVSFGRVPFAAHLDAHGSWYVGIAKLAWPYNLGPFSQWVASYSERED